ncbi:hypothetical protein BGZ51_000090 [Haplosporangium sp. Z 767]|nr:hypothetical protein BGZ51_000090 [Haplosporangium sp. Z 767]
MKRSGSSYTDLPLVDNSIKGQRRPHGKSNGTDTEKDKSKSRKSQGRAHVPRENFPTNFRVVPDSERIEALDKQSVQVLFTKRAGTYSLLNEAFSIKVSRMPFRPPPPPDIPLFVQKAQAEYNQAMAKYIRQQKQLANQTQIHNTSHPPTTTTLIPMPTPPLPLLQYKLRPLRQYPPTVSSPHPSFRVTYVISKKVISKLATHRNLARKKLSAVVEDVFRQHARPGYEYMIFAKRETITSTQKKLKELMIKELENPKLYGERESARSHRSGTRDGKKVSREHGPDEDQVSTSLNLMQEPLIKMRWKNNQPPLHKKWWKYALPNPLGRANQSDAYLNMYCPEAQEALAPIRKMKGRLSKMKHIKLQHENMNKKSAANINNQRAVK